MADLTVVPGAKEIFERFPFGVIFSKSAPDNIADTDYQINYDEDFCYYYFSPGLERRSELRRLYMLDGETNAKRDFPVDFEQYFLDDVEVVQHCTNGAAKVFTEPWTPPGVIGDVHFIYTRKTALVSHEQPFMLGTFELINHVVLGSEASPINVAYDATSPLPALCGYTIPVQWYSDAFRALPIGLAVASLAGGSILHTNGWWDQLAPSQAHLAELSGVTTSTTTPLTTAVWFQESPSALGRGVYHIRSPVDQQVYAVYVLRPAMYTHANPYYENGKLVSR